MEARLARRIIELRERLPRQRSVLVALTGIDGCGKGYLAAWLADRLRRPRRLGPGRALRVALIGVDGWLSLPNVRFDRHNPAENFYEHALRQREMVERLVLPLRDRRSIRLEADYTEETASAYRRHVYAFDDVDVILLEGIYLLKRAFQDLYDLSVWIDCTFETALDRALGRAQEGLSPEETTRAYETIYFPAQRIHFERDDPRSAATLTVPNDPRL